MLISYCVTSSLQYYWLQGTSVCQVTLIGIMVILLYTSRACYNLVVLALTDIENINSFDYDWYNVSDQVSITTISSLSCSFFLHTHTGLSTYLYKKTFSFLFGNEIHPQTLPHVSCL